MRKRLAGRGWVVDVGYALVALVLIGASSLLPRDGARGPVLHVPTVGGVRGFAVGLPVDTADDAEADAEANHRVVIVASLPEGPAPGTSQLVRISRDRVAPHDPAAFPLATPLRGPPQA